MTGESASLLEVSPPTKPSARPPRIVGLDGIRALAAGLVLCYHLIPSWRGAGYVGVDMFFVLSGFLITSLLLRERAVRGTIRIGPFWVRRLRRLMPAVVFATVGAVALARIGGGDALVQLPWQVAGSFTNTYNWLQVLNDAPYFGQRSPLLLANFWSLSVEMQFYLVWPLVLLGLLPFVRVTLARWLSLGAVAASAGWNWYLVHVADEVTRAYVGTDAHAFGLMLGAAVAFWAPRIMVEEQAPLTRRARGLWGILSWVGLLGALAIGIFVHNGPWMYPWGMLAASAFTALTVRGLLPDALGGPSRVLARVLSTRPMTWFGERSYSIYLWHWPLWVIAFFAFHQATLLLGTVVFVVSLVMAEISYRFVETPIRTRGVKPWLAAIGRRAVPVRAGLAVIAAVTLALFVWGLSSSPAQSSTQALFDQAAPANQAEDVESASNPFPGVWNREHLRAYVQDIVDEKARAEAAEKEAAEAEAAAKAAAEAAAAAAAPITGDQVTFIGDSVTLVSEQQLSDRLPGMVIDSLVSRPMVDLPDVARALDAQGNLREYVVVGLATNGFVRDQEIQAMFDALGPDRKIVLVTGYGPQNEYWIFDANAKIREVAEQNPDRIRIAEWEPIAAGHHEMLAGDLTHPGPAGSALYADEVVRALNSFK